MNINEIIHKLTQTVSNATQLGIMHTINQKDACPADAIRLGCNVALVALMPVTPFIANRPKITEAEAKAQSATLIPKMVSTEVLLFGALLAVRMHKGVQILKEGIVSKTTGEEAVEAACTVEFDPEIMAEALEDWKKVTGKKPEDWLDNEMLKSIGEAVKSASIPFDEFLAKKAQAFPSSKTVN